MTLRLIECGASRSLPEGDRLRQPAELDCKVLLIVGGTSVDRAKALAEVNAATESVVAVELETECLEFHHGKRDGQVDNIVGFARFRLGVAEPSDLIEVVRTNATSAAAIDAIRNCFESVGLSVSICRDFHGRIVDTLFRPFINSALAAVDEGLAEPGEMDKALRLGLGYPEGPIEIMDRTGYTEHFEVSNSLYESTGSEEFKPARKSRVLAMRKKAGLA
ncbi:3-hydroxyacyl-CoA dehydrogenase family protein [Caballeronia sp. GAWG2-1]|uniref:3-hydroxyacyl-CoA dehydrogenase family protein n=1 Tax=Caballeronia sp. GAWG2-1 TaxID=2921744 RepID=UPI00202855D8|nr:3-hydroxyacyl-CoA dehydrogenase family protein [Caballeronia sp. GAWG2-1]